MATDLNEAFFLDLDEICSSIAELFVGEAEFRRQFALDFAKSVTASPDRAQKLYDSWEWWGSMGSMSDFQFRNQLKDRKYMALLIRLARLFEAHGVHSEAGAYYADSMESWLKKY